MGFFGRIEREDPFRRPRIERGKSRQSTEGPPGRGRNGENSGGGRILGLGQFPRRRFYHVLRLQRETTRISD